MNDLEKGFVAGLLEGEGTIYRPRSPQLIIYNSNRELLEFVQKLIGGKVHCRGTSELIGSFSSKNGRLRYRLILCGKPVRSILKDILPVLVTKKQRALEIINYSA